MGKGSWMLEPDRDFSAIGFAKKMRTGNAVGIDVWMPMGGGTL